MTPRGLGHGPESPGRPGQTRGSLEPGQSCSGQLADPSGPRTRARITWDSWLNPRPSDPSVIRQGVVVDPAGSRTWARVAWESWLKTWVLGTEHKWPRRGGRPSGNLGQGPICLELQVEPVGPRTQVRVSRDSWSTPRPSEPSRSHPGHLVDTAGPWAWARVAQESWLTPRALGHRREFPGQLVDPVGTRTRPGVAQDSLSTPRALRNGPQSTWKTG